RDATSRASSVKPSSLPVGAASVSRSNHRGPSIPMMRIMPLAFWAAISVPHGPSSNCVGMPSRWIFSTNSLTEDSHCPVERGAAKATGVIRPNSVMMCNIFGPCAPISTCTCERLGSGIFIDFKSKIPVENSEKSKVSMSTESPSNGPISPLMASWRLTVTCNPCAAAASPGVSAGAGASALKGCSDAVGFSAASVRSGELAPEAKVSSCCAGCSALFFFLFLPKGQSAMVFHHPFGRIYESTSSIFLSSVYPTTCNNLPAKGFQKLKVFPSSLTKLKDFLRWPNGFQPLDESFKRPSIRIHRLHEQCCRALRPQRNQLVPRVE